MIIRINTRGNGGQLADYLYRRKDNDHVQILEVDGREIANQNYLKQVIVSMELNAQLTKCKNPYLNAQINPAYGEDKTMTREDWNRAADILAEELGYQDQRRVIVLHTKKGRTHAHVVWERYNHETGKVVPTKNSRLNAKFARIKIEKELGHKPTAWRNNKDQIKEDLTALWNKTATGAEFVKHAKKSGYMITEGTGNRPFMVVNSDGVSCDLVRQLDGVRTKEVRARLRQEKLITDKEAIELIRKAQETNSGKRERGQPETLSSTWVKQNTFSNNTADVTDKDTKQEELKKRVMRFNEFDQQGKEFVVDKRKPEPERPTPIEEAALNFAENKIEAVETEAEEMERLREQIRLQQEEIRNRRKIKGPKR